MSAAPGGYLADEDLDDALLRELQAELAGHGMVIDDPAEGDPVAFRDIPGAWCEIGMLKTGALVFTYLPEGRDLGPDQAARFTLALLGDPGRPRPGGVAEQGQRERGGLVRAEVPPLGQVGPHQRPGLH